MSEPGLNFDPYGEDTSGFFSSIGHAVSSAAKGAAHGVSSAAKGVSKGVSTVGKTLGKVPVIGSGLKGLVTVTLGPYQGMLSVLSGERIDRAILDNLKSQIGAARDIAPYVQTVISFVPGIGAGISGGMSAALVLAQGRPITEAVLAATKNALPGGPLAAAVFDAATAVVQGKGLSDVALAAMPLPAGQKDILRQSLAVAKDIASGKSVSKIVLDRVNDNLSKLPVSVQKATQVGITLAQGQRIQALKAGASALGVSSAMNPFINAAKSLGASQAGIQKAIGAAQAIKNGSPVLKKALNSAVSHFASGSPEHLGYMAAITTLKNTAGNKVALGVARRALSSEAARHGFDTAMGVVAHTVSQNPAALVKRAGSTFTPSMGKAKGIISPYQPNLKNAIDAIKRNPTLASQHPMVLANKFGTSQQTILQALKHVSTQRILPWRSLSPNAAKFVKKWHPNAPLAALTHGSHNTAGLDETGTKYIVAKGDSPFSIAKALTGNGNNWTQLKALNKDKKPDITKNVWVGEVLNIPPSWQKPTTKQAPSPGSALPQQPSPDRPAVIVTPAPQLSTAPGILQAKAILVAWSKTDGVNQAGVTDYGSTAADLSTDFGPRDSTELMSFQNWDNKFGSVAPKLAVDGKLGPKSLAALQQWAEQRAQQATPVTPPVASIPGQVTTLPEIVIEASPPVSPGIPQLPAKPAVVVTTTAESPPALPPVATPSQPATPASVAAAQPAGSSSKMTPALAGAAIGGVVAGLPGAIIGGIAGAVIA